MEGDTTLKACLVPFFLSLPPACLELSSFYQQLLPHYGPRINRAEGCGVTLLKSQTLKEVLPLLQSASCYSDEYSWQEMISQTGSTYQISSRSLASLAL